MNLVAEGECESDEDEEWWVGMVRMEDAQEAEVETLEEINEPGTGRGARYITSILTRKDDSGLEDEFDYLWEAQAPSSPEGPEEDRWWSPEPSQPDSGEDEEEVRYLTQVLGLESHEDGNGQGENPALVGAEACTEEGTPTPGTPRERRPPQPRSAKRRRLRKKVTRSEDQEWEHARRDAWLREMLTDNSESESEERYGRFIESGRWITELTGVLQQAATTPRGECSGQKMPDS